MKLSLSIILAAGATSETIANIVANVEQLAGVDRVSIGVERPGLVTARPRETAPQQQRATGTHGAPIVLDDVVGNSPNELPTTEAANVGNAPVAMGAKWKGTKSDFIRKHPNKSPSEVAALAAKAGIEVTSNVVSALRFNDKKKKEEAKKDRAREAKKAAKAKEAK